MYIQKIQLCRLVGLASNTCVVCTYTKYSCVGLSLAANRHCSEGMSRRPAANTWQETSHLRAAWGQDPRRLGRNWPTRQHIAPRDRPHTTSTAAACTQIPLPTNMTAITDQLQDSSEKPLTCGLPGDRTHVGSVFICRNWPTRQHIAPRDRPHTTSKSACSQTWQQSRTHRKTVLTAIQKASVLHGLCRTWMCYTEQTCRLTCRFAADGTIDGSSVNSPN